jgi:hypothetical protein
MKLRASKQALENNQAKMVEEQPQENAPEKEENALLSKQKEEFLQFLTQEIIKSCEAGKTPFKFLVDMQLKLLQGETLTPNMEAAIRRCMNKDTKKAEPVKEEDLPKVTLRMKPWWIKQNNLGSLVISGVVLRETAKAYLLKGHADMVENCTWCQRCGRALTEPASMVIGYGEICASKIGVPYPHEILGASKKERLKIRKQLLQVLHNQTFELWIPKSQVKEILKSGK